LASSPSIENPNSDRNVVENSSEMTFLGLIGIYDPPRGGKIIQKKKFFSKNCPESKEAVEICRAAGIEVHMVTGDHAQTAIAIAESVSIVTPEENSLIFTAVEFDEMDDQQIDELKILPRVIARCSPESKVKLIEALHRRKRIVAMTGDGVNDVKKKKFSFPIIFNHIHFMIPK
jgi:Na+-exporting ATPase